MQGQGVSENRKPGRLFYFLICALIYKLDLGLIDCLKFIEQQQNWAWFFIIYLNRWQVIVNQEMLPRRHHPSKKKRKRRTKNDKLSHLIKEIIEQYRIYFFLIQILSCSVLCFIRFLFVINFLLTVVINQWIFLDYFFCNFVDVIEK